MNKIWVILGGLFLGACTISSPLTTTERWLELVSTSDYSQAAEFMVKRDSDAYVSLTDSDVGVFMSNWKETHGTVEAFVMSNAVPMTSEVLETFGVEEGYEVYYTLNSSKGGKENLQTDVVKVTGGFRVVWEQND